MKKKEDNSFILVVGSPRSGTTSVAAKIAELLETNLYFEAQWISSLIINNKDNKYSQITWKRKFDRKHLNCIQKCFQNLSLEFEIEFPNGHIIEHSPQNLFILPKLKRVIKVDLIVATVRDPRQSIESLMRMQWNNRTLIRTIFLNLKYLIFLIIYGNNIDFYVNIPHNNDPIADRIKRNNKLKTSKLITPVNLPYKYPIDTKTYDYTEDKKAKVKPNNLFFKILTLPNYLLFKIILIKSNKRNYEYDYKLRTVQS